MTSTIHFSKSPEYMTRITNARYIVSIASNQFLYDEDNYSVLIAKTQLPDIPKDFLKKNPAIYLGQLNGDKIYLIQLETSTTCPPLKAITIHPYLDQIDIHQKTYIFRACQLKIWYQSTKYCGSCGHPTHLDHHEFAKICSHCHGRYYPQYSPSIITCIYQGSKLLLGRSAQFNPGVYSTLAGFIEAGETCEQAVKREVEEEVGIKVANIQYHSSQPWPFPNSMMIGFMAEYHSGKLKIDTSELEDARWFDISCLPKLPIKTSIAYQLIHAFIKQYNS